MKVHIGDLMLGVVFLAGLGALRQTQPPRIQTVDFSKTPATSGPTYPAELAPVGQACAIPAGSGAVFETHFAEDGSGAGTYAFVTHAFADAAKGAVGLIQVGGGPVAAMGH